MKLIAHLAAAAAALVLAAPALAHHPKLTHHPKHARWHDLSLAQKHRVVVRDVRRERSTVRWWLRNRQRFPLSGSAPYERCSSIGIRAPAVICLHGQRLVSALHVLHRIDSRIASAEADAAWASVPGWLHSAFACIHHYEGTWTSNTGNGYYGGLQMDLGFQGSYGPEFVQRWGTADKWPVWAQQLAAARAYLSGRGFGPWPNTARYCGLL